MSIDRETIVNESILRRFRASDTAVLISMGLFDFLAHIALAGRYGFFRDELYNMICGRRLAFGYVDHPPFTPLLARISEGLFGPSLIGIRVFPALAGAATVVLAGLIARRLGGGRFAQVLAALAALFSPVLLNFGALLTNNTFDVLFWTLAAYVLIIILKDGRPRLWLVFGLVAGAALQNKYSILFLLAGLAAGILLTGARRQLLSPWLWLGAALALLLALPNILWQIGHGLPFIELNRNAVQYKNAVLPPLQFLGGQVFEAGLLQFLLILAGLVFLFLSPGLKSVRAFGWAYPAVLAIFVFSRGKTYYIAPFYPLMFAAGALAVEAGIARTRRRGWKTCAAVLLVLTAAPAVPFVLPVLRPAGLTAYIRFLGVTLSSGERKEMGSLPQHFADQFGWLEMTKAVSLAYNGLANDEKTECVIFGQNYGEASAIDFFGPRFGLPPAISGHNNFCVWGPGKPPASVVIVIGGREEDHRNFLAEVTEVGRTRCEFAMPYENDLPIFVCRKPKVVLQDIWPRLKHYD
jgi:hypothetical protein